MRKGLIRRESRVEKRSKYAADPIEPAARAANDTGAATNQVLGASEALATRASDLRNEVYRFGATVRAA